MAFAETIFAALYPLVPTGNAALPGRVYPARFPQEFALPAIRYFVIDAPTNPTICDDGDEETDELNVQLDVVGNSHGEALTLMRSVRASMAALSDPPVTLETWSGPTYDADSKTFRGIMEYRFHGSSS